MTARERTVKITRNKKKSKAGGQIIGVTCAFIILFLGMIGYITHYSATHKQELINNSYNGRQQMLLAKNRGEIFSPQTARCLQGPWKATGRR